MTILGYIVNAVSLGSLYALIAVSVGLVFGVLRQVNLAQGEVIAFGAYTLWIMRNEPAWLAILACVGVCIGGSLVLQVAVFRPLRGASALATLVATFGVSFGLEALWLMMFGPSGNSISILTNLNLPVVSGTVVLRWITLVDIGVAALLLAGLLALLFRTSLGLRMRAVSHDIRAARLVGVRIGRVVTWAFALSGLSASAVAVLATVQTPLITPSFGLSLIVVALVGVVLGDIDHLGRATAGGFVVGFVNSLFGSILPIDQLVYVTSLTFLFVLVALVARPAGLLAARGSSVERV